MSEDSKILYGSVQQLTTEPRKSPLRSGMKRRMQEVSGPHTGAVTQGPHAGSGIGRANSSSCAPMDAGKGLDRAAVEERVRSIRNAANMDEMVDLMQAWLVDLRLMRAQAASAPIGAGPTSRMLTPARVAEIQERIDRDRWDVNYGELCAFIRAWQEARSYVESRAGGNGDLDLFDALAAAVNVSVDKTDATR